MEIVSSPQVSNFSEQPTCVEIEVDGTAVAEAAAAVDESNAAGTSVDCTAAVASSPQKPSEAAEQSSSSSSHVTEAKDKPDESETADTENVSEADEAFAEETAADQAEDSQQLSNESK